MAVAAAAGLVLGAGLAAAPPAGALAERSVTAWLEAHAVPLDSVDAGNGFADLQPLAAMIGSARVVGVGEATHGSSEFFRFKHRLFEYLVEQLGFRTFVMETGYGEGIFIDRYINDAPPTIGYVPASAAEAALATFEWPWATPEVAAMLQWMHDYNADPSHPTKIHFYGDDNQFPGVPTNIVLKYLGNVDPARLAQAEAAVAPFRDDAGLFDYFQVPQAERDAHEAALAALIALFDQNEAAYVASSGQEAFDLARQAAVVILQAKHLYEQSTFREGNNVRDAAMADNTVWALEHAGPGARVMLWAHNLHVEHTSPFWITQGTRLRDALGADYLAVGQNFDRGGFTALNQLQSAPQGYPLTALRQFTLGPSSPGTLNEALASVASPRYIVDVRHAADDPVVGSWWAAPHGQRFAGAVKSPGDVGYINTVAGEAWDLLVEIDVVAAADQLPQSYLNGPGNGPILTVFWPWQQFQAGHN